MVITQKQKWGTKDAEMEKKKETKTCADGASGDRGAPSADVERRCRKYFEERNGGGFGADFSGTGSVSEKRRRNLSGSTGVACKKEQGDKTVCEGLS